MVRNLNPVLQFGIKLVFLLHVCFCGLRDHCDRFQACCHKLGVHVLLSVVTFVVFLVSLVSV